MTNWQPIETAPKDGTVILVYEPDAGTAVKHFVVEWSEIDGTFNTAIADWRIRPTHWQPLPEPPQEASHP